MKFDTNLKLAALSSVCALVAAGVAVAQTAPGATAPRPAAGAAGAPGAAAAPRPAGPDMSMTGYRGTSTVNGVTYKYPAVEDTFGVLDNLPASAPARPKKARKVLVYSRARGYAHSSIPLTAFTVRELGLKTGAWQTTVTYDPNDISPENLARYDVLVLNNTTGTFLDDDNAQATAARKAALLDYVRSGHGLVMTHAAGDSYHGGGRNGQPRASLWPEFSKMTGGFFKFHWTLPQEVTVKIDDAKSPINAAFGGRPFVVHDEIYTFNQDEFSNRRNYHVLTSVDYSKMSAADKAIEPADGKRTDGDYVLSWIRREGQGRIYYNVLGHSEHVLTNPAILKQMLAGIQYAAGDLAANDAPSAK